jgi:hypothetical protein
MDAAAALVTLTSTLAGFDMTVLSLDRGTPPAFYAVTLIVILVTAALLWRRALAIRT